MKVRESSSPGGRVAPSLSFPFWEQAGEVVPAWAQHRSLNFQFQILEFRIKKRKSRQTGSVHPLSHPGPRPQYPGRDRNTSEAAVLFLSYPVPSAALLTT